MDLLKKSSGTTTFPSVVSLNVGGKVYSASITTLKRYSNSMLAAMFSGRVPVETDANGNFFIDRDGNLFRFVLNFLRSSQLNLPVGFTELEQLKQEADFYQIKDLSAILGKSLGTARPAVAHQNQTSFEHMELACRPRFVEVFGCRKTMEECFQKSTFSGYVSTECTNTTEGTANLEIKVTNRRGDYVGNEPKTTIMNALGQRGFKVVSAGYLQDPKTTAIRETIIMSREISFKKT